MDRKTLGIALNKVKEEVTEQLPSEVERQLPEEVAEYCEENFSEWSGALDSGLTQPNMAAPASKVGELNNALTALGLSVVDGKICQTYSA